MSNIKVDNLVNSSGKVVSVDEVAKAVSTNSHINDDSTGADKLSLQDTKNVISHINDDSTGTDKLSLQKTKNLVNNFPINNNPLAFLHALSLSF